MSLPHTRTHTLASNQSSWFQSGRFDLSDFDALELRVRGDGRRFIANLQAPGMARKDDLWQCFVFTRGGPEWENIRVSTIIQHALRRFSVLASFPGSPLKLGGDLGTRLSQYRLHPYHLSVHKLDCTL